MKKILTILLSILLISALALTSCTPSGPSTTDPTDKPTDAPKNTETPPEATEKPLVTISWYLPGEVPSNFDSVMAKANELLEQKINVHLDLQLLNFGEYDTVMNTMMSSAEEFDLCWTASWANDYFGNSNKGAFVPLDDMIDARPELKNIVNEEYWELLKVNGKIYGIPNFQIAYDQPGMRFNKALVDKYDIDINSINSYEDITNTLQLIKDNEPEVAVATNMYEWFKDPALLNVGPMIFIDTNNWKVIEYTDTPDMKAYYEASREWNKKGFFPADIATNTEFAPYYESGNYFMGYERMTPSTESAWANSYPGQEIVTRPTGDKVIDVGSVTSTVTAISATSPNPERAMDFLEVISTDKEIRDVIVYGLEDQDYTRVAGTENTIETIEDGYAVTGVTDWLMGNTFLGFSRKGQPDNLNELIQEENKQGKPGPLVGFSFNQEPVDTEYMNVNAVKDEYEQIFKSGLEDFDKVLPEFKAKMEAAGIETVIAEIQKQLDEWLATK